MARLIVIASMILVCMVTYIIAIKKRRVKDTCEWKLERCLETSWNAWNTSCGHVDHYATGVDKFCRHCGRKIKVVGK